jgi:hypothetical protein
MPPPTVASETLLYEDRSGRVTAGCSCASLFPWMGRMLPRRYRDPVACWPVRLPARRGALLSTAHLAGQEREPDKLTRLSVAVCRP